MDDYVVVIDGESQELPSLPHATTRVFSDKSPAEKEELYERIASRLISIGDSYAVTVPTDDQSDGEHPIAAFILEAATESRPKVTYHIRPKPYVPPKVKRDFRPKTETESQSYLSRHDYRSQQVPPSVHCSTIPCI